MLHASTQQLIRKLCELTEAGALNWKEGEGQCSVFETEGYVVEIQPEPASVRLLRADGHELERADATDLATPWGEGDGTYAMHVADMARHASRIARGAETAIAKILSSLSAPPKKQPEPEPEPAALAFAFAEDKPPHSVRAGESAAAIAAVTADLESQRKQVAEAPPVSHAVPDAPFAVVAPETETAIDRVLAVQPALRPVSPTEPLIQAPHTLETAPKSEPAAVAKIEPAPAPPPPRVIDLPPPFADSTMQPQLPPQMIAPLAAAAPHPPPAPAEVAPFVKPAPASVTTAKAGFGAIDAFSRQKQEVAPPSQPRPEPAQVAPASLLMSGISARSRQTVEPSTAQDFYRPPAAPPSATPQPAPEKKLEPVVATGPDIYKPWA